MNACWIHYADSCSSKQVYLLLTCQTMDHSTTNSGGESPVEVDIAVALASLPITSIHLLVPEESKI
jgi:hypothetical protein